MLIPINRSPSLQYSCNSKITHTNSDVHTITINYRLAVHIRIKRGKFQFNIKTCRLFNEGFSIIDLGGVLGFDV